jgi:hypothetical protein
VFFLWNDLPPACFQGFDATYQYPGEVQFTRRRCSSPLFVLKNTKIGVLLMASAGNLEILIGHRCG